MKTYLSSKERILNTLLRQPVDHLPLTFEGICHGWTQFVTDRFPDPFERALYYLDLGVDTGITLSPPLVTGQNVVIKQGSEQKPGEPYPILTKEYHTPRGSLRQVVRKDAAYPAFISLFDDLNVPPGRSLQYLVTGESDLEVLPYILKAPAPQELESFYQAARQAKKFCDQHQILLSAGLPGIGDPLIWLSGVENIIFASGDQPGFLHRYSEIVARWDMDIFNILIKAGVDLVIRRGWYESTDFWSPRLYKEYLFPPLKNEINLAHEAGVIVDYVMNSGAMPLLDFFSALGVDIYSNIEPDKVDLVKIKQQIGSKMTLCGGVNNYHTLEAGTEEEVEHAVIAAVETLGSDQGYIMAPSDAILNISAVAQRNFYAMIAAWKEIA